MNTPDITPGDSLIYSLDLEAYLDLHGDDLPPAELVELESFVSDFKGYAPDYNYGETAIHEDYFTEYARSMVEDAGYIPADLPWFIADAIDWEHVAANVKHDYSAIEWNSETYYVR